MSRVGQLSKLYHSVPLASEETDETAERQRPSTRRETLNVYPIRSCSYGRGCTPARTAPGWGGVLRGERGTAAAVGAVAEQNKPLVWGFILHTYTVYIVLAGGRERGSGGHKS